MAEFAEAPPAQTAGRLAAAAAQRGVTAHLMDGAPLTTKAAALDAIAAALSFPDWFGRNLDALHDCLTDLSWLPAGEHLLIWQHHDRLRMADPGGYAGVRAALADAVAAEHGEATLSVVLTVH